MNSDSILRRFEAMTSVDTIENGNDCDSGIIGSLDSCPEVVCGDVRLSSIPACRSKLRIWIHIGLFQGSSSAIPLKNSAGVLYAMKYVEKRLTVKGCISLYSVLFQFPRMLNLAS
jgi:hypothetical protein